MKVSFKVANGKVFSNNQSMLNEYYVSENCLIDAIAVCIVQGINIYKFLSHQVVYANVNGETVAGFLVRFGLGDYHLWANGKFYFVEDGDTAYTTREEAAAELASKSDDKSVIVVRVIAII